MERGQLVSSTVKSSSSSHSCSTLKLRKRKKTTATLSKEEEQLKKKKPAQDSLFPSFSLSLSPSFPLRDHRRLLAPRELGHVRQRQSHVHERGQRGRGVLPEGLRVGVGRDVLFDVAIVFFSKFLFVCLEGFRGRRRGGGGGEAVRAREGDGRERKEGRAKEER